MHDIFLAIWNICLLRQYIIYNAGRILVPDDISQLISIFQSMYFPSGLPWYSIVANRKTTETTVSDDKVEIMCSNLLVVIIAWLIFTYLCDRWPRMCSVCRSYNFSFGHGSVHLYKWGKPMHSVEVLPFISCLE